MTKKVNKDRFVKYYFHKMPKISGIAWQTLNALITHVSYETNFVRGVTGKELYEEAGICDNAFQKALKELEAKSVIKREKIGRSKIYHINPNLILFGTNYEGDQFSVE